MKKLSGRLSTSSRRESININLNQIDILAKDGEVVVIPGKVLSQGELGKKVKHAAVVMALRRYADDILEHRKKTRAFDYAGEILMKTNICDFTVVKTASLLAKLKVIHNPVYLTEVFYGKIRLNLLYPISYRI